jgi:hypothetical protein
MKIQSVRSSFNPVNITVETEEELDMLILILGSSEVAKFPVEFEKFCSRLLLGLREINKAHKDINNTNKG